MVGERSSERGFKNAKIIVDGGFKDGRGGGVCQVSTTLYNCALKSGLNIIESHRHSLPVSYVAPSFDAMVSYGSCDLKFENNSGAPLYISAVADGENLKVRFYGIESPYEYRLVSKVIKIIEAKTKVIKREELKEDIREKRAKNGLLSEGYVCIYKDGKLLETHKIREDVYKAVDGIIIEKDEDTVPET